MKLDPKEIQIKYIGDPMCSWCWGMAPQLAKFEAYLKDHGLPLEVWVGGLRAGGGDHWDQKMKDFLQHHWEQVHHASGQPFNFNLLQQEEFNYDTEPACRMVVAGRKWSGLNNLSWFAQLQHSFYVENLDLSQSECRRIVLQDWVADVEQFERHFQSVQVIQDTRKEFIKTREWGVNSYPTVIMQTSNGLIGLAQGYCTAEDLQDRLQRYLLSQKSR